MWVDFAEEVYGLPDFKGRGFKIAPDRHGPPADPDALERVVGAEALVRVHDYRHPDLENVWLVGGGSGHGFKHGPPMAERLAQAFREGTPLPDRFGLGERQAGSSMRTASSGRAT